MTITRVTFTAALVLTLAIGRSAGAEPPASDASLVEDARQHFAAGVVLLRDPKAPRYEEAYREFRAAYAAAPSPKILGNLGLCAMQLERDVEAIEAYERYLHGVDLPSAEREQVEKDLLALRSGLVRVRASSTPPGATLTDTRISARGERVINAYGPLTQTTPLGLRQGHHVIVARLPGYADAQWELESGGADLGEHVFELVALGSGPPPPPPPPVEMRRPVPTSVFVSGGVTVALAATSTAFGILALGKASDYRAANDGNDQERAGSLRDEGQRLNVTTDILLGLTLTAAVVTTVLFLTRPSVEVGSPSRASRQAAASFRF